MARKPIKKGEEITNLKGPFQGDWNTQRGRGSSIKLLQRRRYKSYILFLTTPALISEDDKGIRGISFTAFKKIGSIGRPGTVVC
jgi:hypothetical protein